MFEGHLATRMLASPLVIKLVNKQNTVFVAKLDKIATIGIMRSTDMVHAKLLDQLQALFDGLGIGCRS